MRSYRFVRIGCYMLREWNRVLAGFVDLFAEKRDSISYVI